MKYYSISANIPCTLWTNLVDYEVMRCVERRGIKCSFLHVAELLNCWARVIRHKILLSPVSGVWTRHCQLVPMSICVLMRVKEKCTTLMNVDCRICRGNDVVGMKSCYFCWPFRDGIKNLLRTVRSSLFNFGLNPHLGRNSTVLVSFQSYVVCISLLMFLVFV